MACGAATHKPSKLFLNVRHNISRYCSSDSMPIDVCQRSMTSYEVCRLMMTSPVTSVVTYGRERASVEPDAFTDVPDEVSRVLRVLN